MMQRVVVAIQHLFSKTLIGLLFPQLSTSIELIKMNPVDNFYDYVNLLSRGSKNKATHLIDSKYHAYISGDDITLFATLYAQIIQSGTFPIVRRILRCKSKPKHTINLFTTIVNIPEKGLEEMMKKIEKETAKFFKLDEDKLVWIPDRMERTIRKYRIHWRYDGQPFVCSLGKARQHNEIVNKITEVESISSPCFSLGSPHYNNARNSVPDMTPDTFLPIGVSLRELSAEHILDRWI